MLYGEAHRNVFDCHGLVGILPTACLLRLAENAIYKIYIELLLSIPHFLAGRMLDPSVVAGAEDVAPIKPPSSLEFRQCHELQNCQPTYHHGMDQMQSHL